MIIDLNMFGLLILKQIAGKTNTATIITINNRGGDDRLMKFMKEVANPMSLQQVGNVKILLLH